MERTRLVGEFGNKRIGYEVEFTVPEPFAPFLRYAGGITILPKHILKDSINTTDANGNLKFLSTWGGLLKQEEKRGNYTIYNGGASSDTRFFCFNLNKAKNEKREPFVDPIKSRWFNTLAFRQAVAYGINRDAMKTNIFRGLGELQHSPIAVQSPY